MISRIAGRVRGLFAGNYPENREDEQFIMNSRGDQMVAESLPPLTEIVRLGTGTDFEDGILSGSNLSWTSNVDGQLGTGNNIGMANLSSGIHIISLTGIDSQGSIGKHSITITVSPSFAPVVVIKSPTNNSIFKKGTLVSLEAFATDVEDGTLTGINVTWISDRKGNLGAKQPCAT